MTAAQTPERYLGRNAVDGDGNKIGSVGQVYVNDETGQPDWITVNTGLFGMKENFAPLAGSSFDGEDLVLPFDKAVVKDAPDVADSSHLDSDEQQSLYSYYQKYVGGPGTAQVSGSDTAVGSDTGRRSDEGAGHQADAQGVAVDEQVGEVRNGAGYDTSGPTTDEAMTRSEEHLKVGTQQVEAGRARLRKFVVTEQQTVTVPVSHEEVRVVREPITDGNREDALDGPEISEEEHEVVLHAERPVVETEVVPVERVRIGTETVTEHQRVTGEVRKEQVELHDDTVDPAATTDNR